MSSFEKLNICNDLIYKIIVDNKSRKFVSNIFKLREDQPGYIHVETRILKDYVAKINTLSFLHIYRIILRLEVLKRRDLLVQLKDKLNALTKKRILLYILRNKSSVRPILSESIFQFNKRLNAKGIENTRNLFWDIWNTNLDDL
ncbi:hypothetical protein THOM_2486 [Trachipleistophora hominis]|uniref:Uncharacterized protein n=1 Tax=Trachipleistophora hominis TaxID=72359 RepID=L7JSX0_TRAHO|nr:hypothetical protein THOM_2486 [Trachipleistophora hominis]